MSKGILFKPSDADLEYTYNYIFNHPGHLRSLDHEALLLLQAWLKRSIKKTSTGQKVKISEMKYLLAKIEKRLSVDGGLFRQNPTTLSKEGTIKYFKGLFKTDSALDHFLGYLTVEKYISGNLNWVDTRKGAKGVFVQHIKSLFACGYTFEEVPNEYIRLIALHFFNLKVGIDTIKHTRRGHTNIKLKPIIIGRRALITRLTP